MLSITFAIFATLLANDNCDTHIVRIAAVSSSKKAVEKLKLCTPNDSVVTGQNQIFVRDSTRPGGPLTLVATMDSIGKKGVPLSWSRNTLTIHIPSRSHVKLLNNKVGGVLIRVAYDYSDKAQLRDSY